MPLLNFVCKKCGAQFELLVGAVAEDAQAKCVKCSSKDIEKVFSPFGVNVKGAKSSPPPSCSDGSCSSCPYSQG